MGQATGSLRVLREPLQQVAPFLFGQALARVGGVVQVQHMRVSICEKWLLIVPVLAGRDRGGGAAHCGDDPQHTNRVLR
jgi:hypothetical protein